MILYKPYLLLLFIVYLNTRLVTLYWAPMSVYIHKYKLFSFINSESILIYNAPIFFGFYIEKNYYIIKIMI